MAVAIALTYVIILYSVCCSLSPDAISDKCPSLKDLKPMKLDAEILTPFLYLALRAKYIAMVNIV